MAIRARLVSFVMIKPREELHHNNSRNSDEDEVPKFNYICFIAMLLCCIHTFQYITINSV